MDMPVTVSPSAAKRIAAILAGEADGTMLRLAVTGGGCSGFQYNFALDETRNRLYVLTDEDPGALLKIEPAAAAP